MARWFFYRILPDFQRRDNANTQVPQNRNRRNRSSFCEATVTLMLKPHKDTTTTKNYRSISVMNTHTHKEIAIKY